LGQPGGDGVIQSPLVRRVIKNSGYLFSATGVSAALSIVQSILIARILGAYGFGVLGTIIVFTNIINNFASFRMSELDQICRPVYRSWRPGPGRGGI
jgi:hypothetical protein